LGDVAMLIKCRCGEAYEAGERDAGGWLRCRCGRIVQVPLAAGRTGVAPTSLSHERRATIAHWLGRVSWSYLAIAMIAWGILWTLSDRWWPATVFLFGPRWVLLLPLAVLLPAAIVLRRSLLAPLLASAAILLVPVMGLRIGWRSWLETNDAPTALRVVTLNAGGSDALALELPSLLERWRADILAVQECGEAVQAAVTRLTGWHGHVDEQLCLLSRYPTRDVSGIRWNDLAAAEEEGIGGSTQAMKSVIETPQGPVRVVNLHLETPRKGFERALQLGVRRISENTTLRAVESRRTREWVGKAERSLIIVGDFNMPVEGAIYRRDWSEFRNAFSDAGVGFGATRDNGWIQVRIDHVLTGQAWRARRTVVGPVTGVDHRPVIADLGWTGAH
jgi:endonuclease/exonuclease/phosphatase family metal-dependent hydrolase